MKKLYFSILALGLSTVFTFGQTVESKQRMIITKVTATWCPNCGTGAWDTNKDLIDNYRADGVFLSAHESTSSNLYTTTARDFAANLPQSIGQPLFYLNRTRHNNGTVASAVTEHLTQIKDQTPVANAGVEMQLEGAKISVKARVKFFQPADGEYYLSLFVIEDEVIANQASRGNNVSHPKVLRGRLTPTTFGNLIVDGAVEADQTFDFRVDSALNGDWDVEKLEVAAVIWKKVGEDYEFINTSSVESFTTFTTSVNHLEKAGVALSVYPTNLKTQGTIAINLPTALNDVSLQLINSNGQMVSQLFQGNLSTGTHQFGLTKTSNLASGIYVVRLAQAGQAITQKIVVQ